MVEEKIGTISLGENLVITKFILIKINLNHKFAETLKLK